MASGASSTTTVKVTKQQLFSFLAVHARMPPGDVLLKKQSYAAFEDGVAFCRMFNCVFVQRTIAPIATSHQTSSASGRSARNWKALYRAMHSVGIPAEGILPRELYRTGCGDSVGAYSGLVFFYFMFHLAKRTDFSAEFNADVSEPLSSFLQSMDSIRALVLGGALPQSGVPPEMLEYCTTAVAARPTQSTSLAMSSVDEDDCASDLGVLAAQDSRRQHREAPCANAVQPLPSHPTTCNADNSTAPVRTLFPDEATLEEKTPRSQRLPVPQVTEMYDVSPPSGGVPRPHAASPRLLQRTPRPSETNVQGEANTSKQGAIAGDEQPGHANVDARHTAAQASTAATTVAPATHMAATNTSWNDAGPHCHHGQVQLDDDADDAAMDVDADAAALQLQLLRGRMDPASADAAQATLWRILCAYHTMRDRWHHAAMDLRDAGRQQVVVQEALSDAQHAQRHAEEALAAKTAACEQLRTEMEALGRDAEERAAAHRQAMQHLHDDHIRLRRDYEKVLAAPKAQLAVRCSLLMTLCATLRDLDATSMELSAAAAPDPDVADETAAAIVEALLRQRHGLQAAAANTIDQLKRVDGQSPSRSHIQGEASGSSFEVVSDHGGGDAVEAIESGTNDMVQEALEERIRSVTVSRDQLLAELQRLTEDAAVWCNEATDLRRQKREWDAHRDLQHAMQAELDRRNDIIEDLRRKLGVAMGELDHLSRSAQRRQREQSTIWSIPPPTLTKDAASAGTTTGSPAAFTPNATAEGLHEARSVPRFRLSSPRAVQQPPVDALSSPVDVDGRAPTEARVLDTWSSPMPIAQSIMKTPEMDGATHKQRSGDLLPSSSAIDGVSLRDLEAADVLDHRWVRTVAATTSGPYDHWRN